MGLPLAGGALGHLGHGQELVAERRQPGAGHSLRIVRPGVDGQEAEALAVGVERGQPLVEREPVRARPRRPERALGDRLTPLGVEPARRRLVDGGVQQVDPVGLERRQTRHGGPLPGRPERLPPVERPLGVDGVDVDVMEGRRGKSWRRARGRTLAGVGLWRPARASPGERRRERPCRQPGPGSVHAAGRHIACLSPPRQRKNRFVRLECTERYELWHAQVHAGLGRRSASVARAQRGWPIETVTVALDRAAAPRGRPYGDRLYCEE